MVLNPDCVRDVMLELEKVTGPHYAVGPESKVAVLRFKLVDYKSIHNILEMQEKYSIDEIAYTLIQLSESNYIAMDFSCDEKYHNAHLGNIGYVTPKGHDLIAKIQNENTWKAKLKPIIDKFGSVSLSVIEAIASGATGAIIDKTLGYPQADS